MIATVFTRVIVPGGEGFSLPRYALLTDEDDAIVGNPNGFETPEQAATLAVEVALYGRAPGTLANVTVIVPNVEPFQRFYRVNTDGRLSSVPSFDLDENGFPLALHTS